MESGGGSDEPGSDWAFNHSTEWLDIELDQYVINREAPFDALETSAPRTIDHHITDFELDADAATSARPDIAPDDDDATATEELQHTLRQPPDGRPTPWIQHDQLFGLVQTDIGCDSQPSTPRQSFFDLFLRETDEQLGECPETVDGLDQTSVTPRKRKRSNNDTGETLRTASSGPVWANSEVQAAESVPTTPAHNDRVLHGVEDEPSLLGVGSVAADAPAHNPRDILDAGQQMPDLGERAPSRVASASVRSHLSMSPAPESTVREGTRRALARRGDNAVPPLESRPGEPGHARRVRRRDGLINGGVQVCGHCGREINNPARPDNLTRHRREFCSIIPLDIKWQMVLNSECGRAVSLCNSTRLAHLDESALDEIFVADQHAVRRRWEENLRRRGVIDPQRLDILENARLEAYQEARARRMRRRR